MIRNEKGELVAICNECGAKAYGGTQDDFRAFIQEIKETGWRVKKEDDEWVHYCEDCEA